MLYITSTVYSLKYSPVECTWRIAGKIHMSEATKSALDNSREEAYDVELRGQIEVKVRRE